jgi:hypothetical protein
MRKALRGWNLRLRHLPRPATRPDICRIGGLAARARSIADGERKGDVIVRIFRTATISGTLVDEKGDAIVGMTVRAFRRVLVAGRRMLSQSASPVATTDDRGAYRLTGLLPGEFVVGVVTTQASQPASFTFQGMAPADLQATMSVPGAGGYGITAGGVAGTPDGRFLLQPSGGRTEAAPDTNGRLFTYASVYYPSGATMAQATPVTVASGEDRGGVDMVLRFVATANIGGQLIGPDGPAQNYALHLVPTNTSDLSMDPDVAMAITDTDGSFMFLAVPSGQYVIQTVRAPRAVAPPVAVLVGGTARDLLRAARLTANGPTLDRHARHARRGHQGLTIHLREGVKVSGRVEFDGTSERPPADRLAQIPITLEPADGKARANLLPGRVGANAQFTTPQTPPGKYLLRAAGAPGGWMLKSIVIGGVDVSDTPLDLGDRDVTNAVITYTDRMSSLGGTVRAPQGGPDDAAAVLLFPTDQQAWTAYGYSPRRMRNTRTAPNGTYTFNSLPPGDYFIIAISDEFTGEWQDPRFLETLSRQATRITISEGQRASQELARSTARPPAAR